MAGERLCATGQPAIAVSFRSNRRLTLRGRLAALLGPGGVVPGHIALELRIGRGEGVGAVPARLHDVEEVVRARWVRGCLERRKARVADGAGRQSLMGARVVAGVD